MPNLGAGVDSHVNLTFTPKVVFVPTPGQSTTARIYNEGSTLVYIGGAGVSQYNGLPLPPGGKPIEITNPPGNLYAVSVGLLGSIINTVATLSQATNLANPGLSSVATSAGQPVTMVPGTIIGIGNTVNSYNLEFATVASSVSATVFTANLNYPHTGTEGIYSAIPTYGQIRVTGGVV